MKKIAFILISMLFTAAFALPFNGKITQGEIDKLNNGEVVIRNIDYPKNMCISGSSEAIQKVLATINETKPNYLAEVIQVKPVEGNEDLPQTIRSALENIQDYAGIPYWSERHQQFYNLYDTAKVVSRKDNGNNSFIDADLFMLPFGTVLQSIKIEETDSYLFYEATNTNKLVYQGITCVKPYCMKSTIVLFKDGDNWILYGAGGVKAPRVPLLTPRIETSFINRIKTFCNFIFTKMQVKVSSEIVNAGNIENADLESAE